MLMPVIMLVTLIPLIGDWKVLINILLWSLIPGITTIIVFLLGRKRKRGADSGEDGEAVTSVERPVREPSLRAADPIVLKDINLNLKQIDSIESCIVAIKLYINNNVLIFNKELSLLFLQVENFKNKKFGFRNILEFKFSPNELIFLKLTDIINDANSTIIKNIKSILTIIWNFDEQNHDLISQKNKDLKIQNNNAEIIARYKKTILKLVNKINDIINKIDSIQVGISELIIDKTLNSETDNSLEYIDDIIKNIDKYK
jgi:hypothetical protein